MLATRGIGIGIVSATTAHGWDDVIAIPIGDYRARSRLGVVWRQHPSHPARALLGMVLHTVGPATDL
jgi:DNA-binding transcriptional LysR family regulator